MTFRVWHWLLYGSEPTSLDQLRALDAWIWQDAGGSKPGSRIVYAGILPKVQIQRLRLVKGRTVR